MLGYEIICIECRLALQTRNKSFEAHYCLLSSYFAPTSAPTFAAPSLPPLWIFLGIDRGVAGPNTSPRRRRAQTIEIVNVAVFHSHIRPSSVPNQPVPAMKQVIYSQFHFISNERIRNSNAIQRHKLVLNQMSSMRGPTTKVSIQRNLFTLCLYP